jgi:hypothetical protein
VFDRRSVRETDPDRSSVVPFENTYKTSPPRRSTRRESTTRPTTGGSNLRLHDTPSTDMQHQHYPSRRVLARHLTFATRVCFAALVITVVHLVATPVYGKGLARGNVGVDSARNGMWAMRASQVDTAGQDQCAPPVTNDVVKAISANCGKCTTAPGICPTGCCRDNVTVAGSGGAARQVVVCDTKSSCCIQVGPPAKQSPTFVGMVVFPSQKPGQTPSGGCNLDSQDISLCTRMCFTDVDKNG